MSEMIVKNSESVPLEGELSIFLNFNNGLVVPYFKEGPLPNLITDASKAHLLAMVYDKNASVVPDPILTFRVGDGGTLDGTIGLAGIPGVNPRPLSGAETGLFNGLNTSLYTSDALSHNLENTTTADSGVWAPAGSYVTGNKVSATSASFGIFVFEALNSGTSAGTEPSWNPVLGGTTVDGGITWVTRARSISHKSVIYSFNLSSSQLNGYNISEVGLFKQSTNMFNIKTFASIPKSSAFSIQFLWTIKYV
jgi:hypothetical protein